jgi:virulence-associated protein VapD
MNAPKPPFRSVSEELLYNIYLKVTSNGTGNGITPNDIDTLAKLNSFLTDAVLMKADDIVSAINALKGNVPVVANSLEKLYNIVQGLTYLKREDIDHLAELNAIVQDADLVRTEDLTNVINGIKGNPPASANTLEKLYNIIQGLTFLKREDIDQLTELNAIVQDADLIRTEDLTSALNGIKGSVPVNGNTLEKLYNLIQGFSFLKREDIDTIGELNALVTDGDLVRVQDLADALVGLNLKKRTLQFFFSGDWDDDEHYNHYHDRDAFVLRGKINSLSHDFTHQLSGVTYKSRLDVSSSWTSHSTLTSLQSWINANATGDETTGTKYWIRCLPIYKQGYDDEAMNILTYNVQ